MAVHDLDCHLGDRSPLGALYRANAVIVLLGVGLDSCTALHLAEYRLPEPPPRKAYRCYVRMGTERVQVDFDAPALDARDFDALGRAIEEAALVKSGPIGRATARIMAMPVVVDFAIGWMHSTRRREDDRRAACGR